MRRAFATLAILLASGAVGLAQIAIYDPAVTFRNSVTAVAKQYLLTIQEQQHRQLRRMARRLSMHTSLDKYKVPDPRAGGRMEAISCSPRRTTTRSSLATWSGLPILPSVTRSSPLRTP